MFGVKETVSLRLPDEPDVNKLLQMYNHLFDNTRILNGNIGGILFNEEFYNKITSVYPEDAIGCIPSNNVFVRRYMRDLMCEMEETLYFRHQLSISGAMRYPWSQEARLDDVNEQFRYF